MRLQENILTNNLTCLACITFLMVGCAGSIQTAQNTTEEKSEVADSSESVGVMEYLAAIDLVNTVVQVPRLHPGAVATLQMRKPRRGFGQQVYEVMTAAGYNIRIVEYRNGQNPFVSYSDKPDSNDTIFQIDVDDFKVRRTYSIVNDVVTPKSSIYLYGADPDVIKSNDAIFRQYQRTSTL